MGPRADTHHPRRSGYRCAPRVFRWLAVPIPSRTADADGFPWFGLSHKAGAVLEEETIQATLANELAKFKQPKKVFVTTELPRNAMGKVQKKDLRAQHSKTFTT